MRYRLSYYIILFVALLPHNLWGQSEHDTVGNVIERVLYDNLSGENPVESISFNHIATNKSALAGRRAEQSIRLGLMGVTGLNILNGILATKYGWNPWIDIPADIVASGAMMIPFVLWHRHYTEKEESGSDSIDIISVTDTATAAEISGNLNLVAEEYGTSSIEYGRWMMLSSAVCFLKYDIYTANKMLHEGASIIRNNGKGQFGGLDTIDELFYRQMMTHIEDACGRDYYAIKHCRRATELARLHFGSNSKLHLYFLLHLSSLQAQRFHYRQSLRTHNKGYKAYVQLIKDEFCQRSDIGRANYWQNAKSYIYATVDLASNISKQRTTRRSCPLAGPTYNALLLSKGLLLNTTVGFENHIKSSNIPEANALLEQKKRLLSDNAADSILDSIDLEILRILRENDKPYTIPTLDITWDSVQAALGDDDLAIEFFRTRSNEYGAVLLRKNWSEPQLVMLDNIVKIGKSHYTLDDILKQQMQIDTSFSATDLWSLSRSVWTDEILKYFPRTANGRVFFSADGEIQVNGIEDLPILPAKRSSSIERKKYVSISDVYDVCRLSSTRELALRRKGTKEYRAAIFGGLWYDFKADENLFYLPDSIRIPQLPGTLKEADDIIALLEEDTLHKFEIQLLSDTAGTEDAFKKLSTGNLHLIHLATHGFVSDDIKGSDIWMQSDTTNPLATSGLLLTSAENRWFGFDNPEGGEDGILTSQEISTMDLHNTDLVVLSACVTGKGIIGEDGVFGLQRGFKMAGVGSILMSLWYVNDWSTTLLMTYFYENHYIKNMPKQKALNEAKAAVRNFEVDESDWKRYEKQPNEETWNMFLAEQRGIDRSYKPLSTTSKSKQTELQRIRPFEDPMYWAAFILLDAID